MNITHGHNTRKSKSGTWLSWNSMKKRCLYPSSGKGYLYCGAKGIKVCDKWLKFEGFLEDMGIRPEGMSLDRIDCYGNYTKENCRWATRKQQDLNMKDTLYATLFGTKKPLMEWCEFFDISYGAVQNRLKSGLSHWDALRLPTLTTPLERRHGLKAVLQCQSK
jgi:hypothetical protein